jgi:nucleoside-diphosphate-sugar epimerase
MIYDGVTDGNIARIAAFVSRRGWFPVAGPARGLRRPVHADDVAAACVAAVERMPLASPSYTLSGRDPLPFSDLVAAVFGASGLPPRIVHVPRPLVAVLLPLARRLGIAAGATSGMAARMNDDLDFSHAAATADLGFRPRPFMPRSPLIPTTHDTGLA